MNKYMILPIFDTVILPDVDYQFGAADYSDEEKKKIHESGSHVLLVPIREDKNRSDVKYDDFFEIGVLAEVVQIQETPFGTRMHVKTGEKGYVSSIFKDSATSLFEGEFTPIHETPDITQDGIDKLLDHLKKQTLDTLSNIEGGENFSSYIDNCASINDFASMFCQFFGMTPEQKYELLKTDSLKERGMLVEDALLRFKGTVDMQVDLNKRYNDTEGNVYKKAALQKQIALMQDELDDMDPDSVSEENEYRKKIDEAGMPEEAKKEVDRVLKRFLQSQPNDPERTSLENYLDFVTSLKWQPDKLPPVKLKKARTVLDKDHYGLKKVKDRILEQIAVMTLKREQGGSILLLVGAPGTGKTSLGKSVATALGRKYVRISLGGIRDEAEIRGHRRTYVGAMPGRIMEGIKRSGSMNPVVVLDEVDKLSQGINGDPSSALLEVLDPEQNNTFTDHYMNIPYDLSNVFFICTANTYDTIPQPLLDRMEMIQLPGYTAIEKLQIGKRHLLPRAMADCGLTRKELRVTDGAIRRIISEYTMESGVRGLKKQLDTLCRKAAAELVEKEEAGGGKIADARESASGEEEDRPAPISVKEKNIPDYLGHKVVLHDRALKSCPPGVVTGLAWTQAGGEILFIETTAVQGSGKVIITGQLGDVMKESASISLTLVKEMFGAKNVDFDNKDIHIHVPEGAVPKDGPSAGVTLFTALVSLVTGVTADPHLAMTGEISLRGDVLPIGGLPEKLMAALRAGIRTVLIPEENVQDLDDVADEVREKLEIIPVSNIREVIQNALHIRLPKKQPVFHLDRKEETDES